MKHLAPIVILAVALAGGCGAKRDAAKETPIDWPARAATVKVGMTRAEVEKILPRWVPHNSHEKRPGGRMDDQSKLRIEVRDGKHFEVIENPSTGAGSTLDLSDGFARTEWYLVEEGWQVEVAYDYTGGAMPSRQSNGELAIRVYWALPEDRLLAPVKITKVKKPLPSKP